MFNTGNCPSVPIVANLDGNNNGNNWNDGSWLWFLIVVFAIFGGWGNGFGGFGGTNGGVGSEIQRGFDNSAVISKLDGISNGLCDGFYAMNNSMLTGFNGINTNIMQTGYGIQQAVNADTVANMQNTKSNWLGGESMHIERIHKMQECLTEKAVNEFEKGIENVDTSEMGEVVDMIKDLAEAEYHSIISKAMKKADEEEEEYDKELLRSLKAEYGEESGRRYYDQYRYANGRFAPKGRGIRRGYEEPPYYHMPVNYNDMEYMRDMDKSRGKMYYSEPIAPHVSESNYDRAKRHYTETKEMHKGASTEDKEHKMKALDMYIRELSGDISELLNDMTPDERNLLRTKMSNLASKL